MGGPDARRLLGAGAFIAVLSLATAASIPFDAAPWLRGPAPYPPEWQWAFRPGGPAGSLGPAAACAALLLGLVAAGLTRAARLRAVPVARALVGGAVVLGCAFQVTLLAREPGSPLETLLGRTRSRSFTSHHAVAVSPEARDPLGFLRRHADLLPRQVRSAKHSATHPPGPVLYYRAALALCEWSPALTRALLGPGRETAGAGEHDTAEAAAAAAPRGEAAAAAAARGEAAAAAALLGALGLALLGALSAWPIYLLARQLGSDPLAAARVATLWGLLPGPALMTPQFDQALALPLGAATSLLLRAGAKESSRPALAVGAGLLGGVALFFSYGAAAFLLVCGVAALAAAPVDERGDAVRRRAVVAGGAALTAAVVAFGVPALLGHESLQAVTTALRIHREVYTEPRSYALWLLFNPLDLALFLGLPVALVLLLRALPTGDRLADTGASERFRRVLLAGLVVLVVSGVTRGEVGRLFIPLMPALLVAALAGRDDAPQGKDAIALGALVAVLTLTMAAYWIT